MTKELKAHTAFNLSLEKKLPILISLLILLVILTLSWTAYFGIKRASLQVGQERLNALIEQFSDLFEASSEKVKASTRKLALDDTVKSFLIYPGKTDLASFFLHSQVLQTDSLTSVIQILDNSKEVLFSSNGVKSIFSEINDTVYADASVSPAFSAIGNLRMQKNSMEYPVVVAVVRDNVILGYLVRWRLVMSDPNNIRSINRLLGENASLYIGNADYSLWTNFLQPTPVHKFNPGQSPRGEYLNEDKKSVLGAIAPIPGTQWAFIIELSKTTVLETADCFLKWIVTFDIGILLVAFILAWFMSRRITKPINILSAAAASIAEGNYNEPVDIKRRDEVGQLARAFNIMSERIADAKNELEHTVEVRTSQLQSANQELDELNKKLRELDQIKTNFFTNISHELRTPLTLILGPLEKLRNNSGMSESLQKEFQVIYRNAAILLKQVNNLLDLSRLEAGKLRLHYEEFDIVKMINLIAAQFELLKIERNVALDIKTPDALSVQADPEKIERIITNLISNAFKFTPIGGKIEITAENDESKVIVKIRDSGPGINPSMLEGIFERFQGTDVHPGRSTGSSGLGLSIAREFIELHKGNIAAENSKSGGAEFRFALPIVAANHLEASQEPIKQLLQIVLQNPAIVPVFKDEIEHLSPVKSARSHIKKKASILVVEDNTEMNRFIAEVLSDKYNVECAFNGDEGFKKALQNPPDLIITDIMMPVMPGNEMTLKLQKEKRTRDIPVIILSAKTDDIFMMDMLKAGAQDYLRKPFSIEELRVRTDNIIDMKLSKEKLRKELDRYSEDLTQLVEELAEKKHLLETSLAEKTILLKEVHHRVKNNLQIIASLLNLQTTVIKDPAMLDVFRESQNRIRSMALIHEKLYGSQNGFAKINLRDYTADLVNYLFHTYHISTAKIKSEIDMPDVVINLDSAVSIGLILSELIANAVKHALNKLEKGSLIIKYIDDESTSTLTVKDNGKGFAQQQDEPETLGMVIIKTLTEQLKGSYEIISNHGTEVRIHFPYSLATEENVIAGNK